MTFLRTTYRTKPSINTWYVHMILKGHDMHKTNFDKIKCSQKYEILLVGWVMQLSFMMTPSCRNALRITDLLWVNSPVVLQWRQNGHESVSSHQPHVCLLNRLFRRRSKKTSKLHVIGLCAGNSPGTGEFPAQMASNAENVSIWWRHHGSPQEGQAHIQSFDLFVVLI